MTGEIERGSGIQKTSNESAGQRSNRSRPPLEILHIYISRETGRGVRKRKRQVVVKREDVPFPSRRICISVGLRIDHQKDL